MENENYEHIVEFEKCKECKYYKIRQDEQPCDECLANAVNYGTTTPLYFEKDKSLDEEEKK